MIEAAPPRAAVRRLLDDRARATRAGSARRWPSAAWSMLDAPVTGSSPRAEDGTLTIMVGGAERGLRARTAAARDDGQADRARRRARPGPDAEADQQLARRRQRGGGRRGAAARATRPAIDLDALVEVVSAGSGASAQLELKAAADARARLHDAVQDRAHAQGRAPVPGGGRSSAGVPFPAAAHARDLLIAAMGRGHGEEDYAAHDRGAEGLAGRALCKRAVERLDWPVSQDLRKNASICRGFGIFAQVSYL